MSARDMPNPLPSAVRTSDFVHEYEDEEGRHWYVVAKRCGARDYYAECTWSVFRRTGWRCVLGSLSLIASSTYLYTKRASALRRARGLYGARM